jgi:hypothetical protein
VHHHALGEWGPLAHPHDLGPLTGVSEPYEMPADASMVPDTTELTPESAAQAILSHLEREGYFGVNDEPLRRRDSG